MHRVIIVGSPRPDGRSASLADELFNACIEECPEDGVSIVSVASTEVAPCVGCEACAQTLEEAPDDIAEGDPLEPCALIAQSDAALHQCVIDDALVKRSIALRNERARLERISLGNVVGSLLERLRARLAPHARRHLRACHRDDGHPVFGAFLDTGVEKLVGQRGASPVGTRRADDDHAMHPVSFPSCRRTRPRRSKTCVRRFFAQAPCSICHGVGSRSSSPSALR